MGIASGSEYTSPVPEIFTDHWEQGAYRCAGCGAALFDSSAKFSSGTAWPSFRKPMRGSVVRKPDYSQGLDRTEILCGSCGAHLGHVFEDGKICGDAHPEAGERYCVLSDALAFEDEEEERES